MRTYLIPISSAVIMIGSTLLHADVNMHEGLWKMTVQTQMSGLPMQIPPTSFTQCITKKDLIPKDQEGKKGKCKITQQNISGNTVSWVMECKEDATMKAVGRITYHGNTFEGTTDISTVVPKMGTMKMKQQIKGKRIGECKR